MEVINETLLLCSLKPDPYKGGGGGGGGGGGAALTGPVRIIWLLGHTRRKVVWVSTLQPPQEDRNKTLIIVAEHGWQGRQSHSPPFSRYVFYHSVRLSAF